MSVSLKISHVRSSALPFTFSSAWYMGTVPTGTGQLRIIHSLVSWIFLPVERSMSVSPPQRQLQTAFSTSSSMPELTAELPILVLIFTRSEEHTSELQSLRHLV